MVGTEAEVRIPAYTRQFDYELEWGIFIGRGGVDIPVERARVTAYDNSQRVTEADLSGHLANGNGEGRRSRAAKSTASELLASDNQLYEALTLLKGINILGLRDNNTRAAPSGDS